MSPRKGKGAPPAPDPRHGRNPGYAEPHPRDKDDAREPPTDAPEPDEGGVERDPDPKPEP